MTTYGNPCWTLSMYSAVFLKINVDFFFSVVKSRGRKRLKRCVHERKGIVCRTMCALCTHLRNDYSVLIINVVMYVSSYCSCFNTDAKTVAICEGFFMKAMIRLCPFKAKWDSVFDCKCILTGLCMRILSYSFFRSS